MHRPRRPAPTAHQRPVATGTAALVPDPDGRGWTVFVNGVESSHVDLEDPTRLVFEYMRWMSGLVDALTTPDGPLRVVHLGGAGCTLAQYVAARRPLSRQLVVEIDPDVLDLAREAFGLRSGGRLRLRAQDALEALTVEPDDGADVVIRDAFSGAHVPAHLTSAQFVEQVHRVLRPDGVYLANIADDARLAQARREAVTALQRFPQVALVAEPSQLRGRRYGNVVLAASHSPLPLQAWSRRLSADPVRARLLDTDEVRTLTSGSRAFD